MFIYSEKATKFCEISTNHLTGSKYIGQIIGGDFGKICGLLRIYELYLGNPLVNNLSQIRLDNGKNLPWHRNDDWDR